jgi:hypothetical protein
MIQAGFFGTAFEILGKEDNLALSFLESDVIRR